MNFKRNKRLLITIFSFLLLFFPIILLQENNNINNKKKDDLQEKINLIEEKEKSFSTSSTNTILRYVDIFYFYNSTREMEAFLRTHIYVDESELEYQIKNIDNQTIVQDYTPLIPSVRAGTVIEFFLELSDSGYINGNYEMSIKHTTSGEEVLKEFVIGQGFEFTFEYITFSPRPTNQHRLYISFLYQINNDILYLNVMTFQLVGPNTLEKTYSFNSTNPNNGAIAFDNVKSNSDYEINVYIDSTKKISFQETTRTSFLNSTLEFVRWISSINSVYIEYILNLRDGNGALKYQLKKEGDINWGSEVELNNPPIDGTTLPFNIQGLDPDTDYELKMIVDDVEESFLNFSTRAATPATITIQSLQVFDNRINASIQYRLNDIPVGSEMEYKAIDENGDIAFQQSYAIDYVSGTINQVIIGLSPFKTYRLVFTIFPTNTFLPTSTIEATRTTTGEYASVNDLKLKSLSNNWAILEYQYTPGDLSSPLQYSFNGQNWKDIPYSNSLHQELLVTNLWQNSLNTISVRVKDAGANVATHSFRTNSNLIQETMGYLEIESSNENQIDGSFKIVNNTNNGNEYILNEPLSKLTLVDWSTGQDIQELSLNYVNQSNENNKIYDIYTFDYSITNPVTTYKIKADLHYDSINPLTGAFETFKMTTNNLNVINNSNNLINVEFDIPAPSNPPVIPNPPSDQENSFDPTPIIIWSIVGVVLVFLVTLGIIAYIKRNKI